MSKKRNRVFIIHEDSIDHNDLICALCSLDARELVRCKDCKFGTNEKNGKGENVIECSMSLEHICHSLDYYCADGEMK